MHIERQDRDQVVISTRLAKARDLLDGLIAYRSELGDLGRELEEMLRAAGVEPSAQAGHIRYEYMPPTDLDRH
ncbi:hypothetical protein Tgr7_0716 [Thioalkalivibrio sulfidiphilus HL-EbGr7]|uniref:Uncharacterized protein n=1 Tax=Thioalkalivibrio sulfidiphilus (strain HL-EbGR7) TaxID=396588 RepID=B8GMH6_THISH|nr:hypothetical protein [Thioalkalivibrio sulfidiphilus]ACL71808.1 hypothetical protein Tgr7_0716 [Thioalkalivibrio sulfidiphilus HL-EbGr7]